MQGRGFVPSEQIFVARLESMEGLKRTKNLPNGKRGFWGIALRRDQSELQLGAARRGDREPNLIG
jgi:hypothetical protein